jgi:glycosyltransferase involved in cell wall biosynthesis
VSNQLRRVLFVSGSANSATLRYRVRLAEESLRSRGVMTAAVHFTEPKLLSWAEDADVLALYRVPLTRSVASLVETLRRRGTAVTFDIDDRVFLSEHLAALPFLDQLSASDRVRFTEDVPLRGRTAMLADRASGTTAEIVDDLSGIVAGPARLLPNGVGRAAQQAADAVLARPRELRRNVRLGYFSGSATHDEDWALIEADVVELMRQDPSVELWLVGKVAQGDALGPVADRVRLVPPVDWLDLYELLGSVDVNLAPLALSSFTAAKSAIKWLEAALVRTPTVATATPPFRAAIEDGTSSLLVPAGQSWTPTLARLVDDLELRERLGGVAREQAMERYGPLVQAERYLEHFEAALQGPRSQVATDRLVQAKADARRVFTVGVSLEPYPFPADLSSLRMPEPGWAGALSQVRTVARTSFSRGRRLSRRIGGGVRRRVSRPHAAE